MGKNIGRRLGLVLSALVVVTTGCTNEDQDRLARVGRKTAEKVEAAAGGDGKLQSGLRAIQADLDEMALDARVSARLRWDKSLAGSSIQVRARSGVVELKGTVKDLAQRRRAVELAETTVGAEKVSDTMEVPAQEP